MNVLTVNHVQITIPPNAENEARAFYCGLLGFREVPKPAVLEPRGGFWMDVGGFPVHIGTEERNGAAATKAHVAYEVDDLDGWRSHLATQNVKVTDGIQIPGFLRFEFRDPLGNRIEFLQSTSPGTL
jgi:catechol 2,3-dioxygenase-like lactoylglutathione lyase family enzyme